MAKPKHKNPIIQLSEDWINFAVTIYEYNLTNGLADIDDVDLRFLFDIYRREHFNK